MAIKVASITNVVQKWKTNAGSAGQSYTTGVQNPKNLWAATTAAASTTWAAGVNAAVTNGSFAKGVNAAGDSKWQNGAVTKGATRYTQGVGAGATNYQTAMGPVLQTIANVTLPPRGPKGDPGNINRVSAVCTALRAAKVGS